MIQRSSDGGKTWEAVGNKFLYDGVTHQRRPFLRLFACELDLSHEAPDAPLPDAVATGAEPLLVVGAMAGG